MESLLGKRRKSGGSTRLVPNVGLIFETDVLRKFVEILVVGLEELRLPETSLVLQLLQILLWDHVSEALAVVDPGSVVVALIDEETEEDGVHDGLVDQHEELRDDPGEDED